MEKSLHIYIYTLEIRLGFIGKVKNSFVFLKFIEQKRYIKRKDITIGTIIFVINGCANIKYTYRLLVMSVLIEIKI